MDLKIVHKLVQIMERHGLTEVEIAEENNRVRVVRPAGVQEPPATASSQELALPSTTDLEVENDPNSHFIVSPMVGTFYVAQSPEDAPFVGVGDLVKPGKVVAIIEAMKVMNEIKSEFSGTVVKVLVENGSPVEYGQKLFEIQ